MIDTPETPAGQAPEPVNQPDPQGGEPAQPSAQGADVDRWKTKFEKADGRNVELSGRLREATEQIGGYEKQIADLTKTNEELLAKASEADEMAKGLKGEKNRRQLTDAVLAEVAPSLRGEATLMLKGLMAEEYQVDHTTPEDDIGRMAGSALEKLKQQAQRLFSDAPRTPGDASKPDLSAYRSWHDVPPHLQKSATSAEFARLTGQGHMAPQSLFNLGK